MIYGKVKRDIKIISVASLDIISIQFILCIPFNITQQLIHCTKFPIWIRHSSRRQFHTWIPSTIGSELNLYSHADVNLMQHVPLPPKPPPISGNHRPRNWKQWYRTQYSVALLTTFTWHNGNSPCLNVWLLLTNSNQRRTDQEVRLSSRTTNAQFAVVAVVRFKSPRTEVPPLDHLWTTQSHSPDSLFGCRCSAQMSQQRSLFEWVEFSVWKWGYKLQ